MGITKQIWKQEIQCSFRSSVNRARQSKELTGGHRLSLPRAFEKEIETSLQSILKKLIERYKPQKVILFGSYAYGFPNLDSDLDLLIIKETSVEFLDRLIEVREILSDPNRNIPLEVIVLTPQEVKKRTSIGDQFITQIIENGTVLYAA